MATNMTFVDFVTPVPADWLNNVNFVVNNPPTPTYIPPFTGGVSRTVTNKFTDFVSVLDFGADPTGVADSTTDIQNAITACQLTGKALYFPAGVYSISAVGLSITAPVQLVGDGRLTTTLSLQSTTATTLSINTTGGCIVEGLNFAQLSGATSGAAITLTATSSENQNSRISNCFFSNSYIGFNTQRASTWILENCLFGNNINTGALVQNLNNADSGDSTILNCDFINTSANSCVAIQQASSGGLKIVGCKAVGNAVNYQLALAGTQSTSDLLITGCSFEGATAAGLNFFRQSGSTAVFSNVSIVGCELGSANNVANIQQADSVAWLSNVTITGNTHIVTSSSGTPSIVFNNIAGFSITGNSFNNLAGGTTAGIDIGSACSGGRIGSNSYINITVPISNSSTNVAIDYKTLTGTVSITPTTSYGTGLFSGTAAVTFPSGFFGVTPTVQSTVQSGTAGIGTYVQSVTTSGFTQVAITATSGQAQTIAWQAQAIY